MKKARKISGFPELTPGEFKVFKSYKDKISHIFELYGFIPMETRNVEEIGTLGAEGTDVDKEIYGIRRIDNSSDAKIKYALHYDLTVPFARYLAMNLEEVTFPYKRYQIQHSWRGERPQEGRYREFLQCDIDVVSNDTLSLHYDVELPLAVLSAFQAIGIEDIEIKINNRKILEGFYRSIGITSATEVIRVMDKIDKLGPGTISQILLEQKLSETQVKKCIALASIKKEDSSFVDEVLTLSGTEDPMLTEGLKELSMAVEGITGLKESKARVVADLSVARGLDYYTGIVFEVNFTQWPEYPSICGGGRYDNLVSDFVNRKLPGIGASIGLTRVFLKLLKENKISLDKIESADLLVLNVSEELQPVFFKYAHMARKNGIRTDFYPDVHRMDKQLKYADKKGIRFVCFPCSGNPELVTIKDMDKGDQEDVDFNQWIKDRELL